MPQQLYHFLFIASPQDYGQDRAGALVPFSYVPWDTPSAYQLSWYPHGLWDSVQERSMALAGLLTNNLSLHFEETPLMASYLKPAEEEGLENFFLSSVIHPTCILSDDLLSGTNITKNIAEIETLYQAGKATHYSAYIPDEFELMVDTTRHFGFLTDFITSIRDQNVRTADDSMRGLSMDFQKGKRIADIFEGPVWSSRFYLYDLMNTQTSVMASLLPRSAMEMDYNADDLEAVAVWKHGYHFQEPDKIKAILPNANAWKMIEDSIPYDGAVKLIHKSLFESFGLWEFEKVMDSIYKTDTYYPAKRIIKPSNILSAEAKAVRPAYQSETPVSDKHARKIELTGIPLSESTLASKYTSTGILLSESLLASNRDLIGFMMDQKIFGQERVLEARLETLKLGENPFLYNRQAYLLDSLYQMDIVDAFLPIYGITPEPDDREDLLIIPNQDFPYQSNISRVYDENGVPYQPLSDPSSPSVKVLYPIEHPFPDWAQVAIEEVWVNLWPLKDVMLILVQIWRLNRMKLAGMTMNDALELLLQQLYAAIEAKGNIDLLPDYLRIFRLVRWYAERLIINNTDVILNRTYNSWTDKLTSSGDFNCPHTLTNFSIDSSVGLVQSTGPNGTVEIQVTNFVAGQLTFSTAVQGSSTTSYVEVTIDGELRRVVGNDGLAHRLTFDLDPGQHTVLLSWLGAMGDTALFSGFVVTGAVFVEANTTFNDPDTVQGAQATNLLLHDLMKYYQDHWDQWKNKGSLIINQRKPWIEN